MRGRQRGQGQAPPRRSLLLLGGGRLCGLGGSGPRDEGGIPGQVLVVHRRQLQQSVAGQGRSGRGAADIIKPQRACAWVASQTNTARLELSGRNVASMMPPSPQASRLARPTCLRAESTALSISSFFSSYTLGSVNASSTTAGGRQECASRGRATNRNPRRSHSPSPHHPPSRAGRAVFLTQVR